MQALKNRVGNIWVHLIGVIFFLMMPVLFSPDLLNSISLFEFPPFQREFVTYVLLVVCFYANYLFFVPKLYLQKKHLYFALSLLVCFAIIAFLPNLIIKREHMDFATMPTHHIKRTPSSFSRFHIGQNLIFFLAVVFLALALKINGLWKQSQKEKLDAELAYLKAQINPHFLFNTLNSIYSLALEKSETTASAIAKLSGMMRYVISDAHHEIISMRQEIGYISDYIELQKLRLPESVNLEYVITGDSYGKQIAPLLLIPFIENAFKYGVNAEKPSRIVIHIRIEKNYIHLSVANNIVSKHAEKSGVGIKNAKERLELLYPDKHQLFIEKAKQQYRVSLQIHFV